MFMTRPSFEAAIPTGLAERHCHYWRAVGLTVHLPWYVAWLQPADAGLSETLLIADTETLRSVVQQMRPSQVTSLRVISLDVERPTWEMRPISEVWRPADDEHPAGGPLLIRLRGEPNLVDGYLQPVADRAGRKVILRPMDHAM